MVDKSAISGGGFLLQLLLLVRSYPVHLDYYFLLGDALHRFIICIDLQPSVSMALEGVRTELEVLYFLCCLIEFKQRVSRLLLLVSSHFVFFSVSFLSFAMSTYWFWSNPSRLSSLFVIAQKLLH